MNSQRGGRDGEAAEIDNTFASSAASLLVHRSVRPDLRPAFYWSALSFSWRVLTRHHRDSHSLLKSSLHSVASSQYLPA